MSLGLDREVADGGTYRRTVEAFRAAGILLPTFAQLAAPRTLPARTLAALGEGVPADAADPGDNIPTPGTESNVKEIYDKCAELSADPVQPVRGVR